MPRDKQTYRSTLFILISICILAIVHIPLRADLSSIARNDAYPVFTTLNSDDSFLLTKQQLYYKEAGWADRKKDRVNISISPFGQNADRGKTLRGERYPLPPVPPTVPATDINPFYPGTGPQTYHTSPMIVPLGDITGRMGMIALLFGAVPAGKTLPSALVAAQAALFSSYPNNIVPADQQQQYIDFRQLFGYFSNILKYREQGVRFEATGRIYKGFGLKIQTGVSTIRQTLEARVDMTPIFNEVFASIPNPCVTLPSDGCSSSTKSVSALGCPSIGNCAVEEYLMKPINTIATEIGLDIGDFLKTSVGEVRFNLFWRDAYELNKDAEEWAHFLLIPYAEISGSVSPGKKENFNILFEAPFGNNGHSSFGFTTGVNFDFIETIEIGGEVGFTTFFKKSFCNYHVPNSEFQTTIFPFATDVTIKPGHSWHFLARLAAYHFLDNLSMHFEWVMLTHNQDCITLDTPDPAFLPHVLEKMTTFKTKLGNAGFNYDISPNIGLGFLWQIPFSQRNSYRSSTLMGGINVTF